MYVVIPLVCVWPSSWCVCVWPSPWCVCVWSSSWCMCETLIIPDQLTFSLPAGTDITITSPLCPAILGESCHQAGEAAFAAEAHRLHSNGPKCQELGWSCIPLAVVWKLGQRGPCYHFKAGISPGHSPVFLQVISGGCDLWAIGYCPDQVHCQSHPGKRAPTLLTANVCVWCTVFFYGYIIYVCVLAGGSVCGLTPLRSIFNFTTVLS